MSLPLYLVSPSARFRDSVEAELSVPVVAFDSLKDLDSFRALEPGVLLMDASAVPEAEVLMCTAWASGVGGAWCVGLVEESGGTLTVRTLSLGSATTLAEVAAFASEPSAHGGALLDLRRALIDAGRLRHDVNNPLATAMMEIELLLGGEASDEVRESVEVVQRQLQKIRDLIIAAGHLRAARD